MTTSETVVAKRMDRHRLAIETARAALEALRGTPRAPEKRQQAREELHRRQKAAALAVARETLRGMEAQLAGRRERRPDFHLLCRRAGVRAIAARRALEDMPGYWAALAASSSEKRDPV